jgi:dsRNA-specific ribonuclease
LVQKGMLGGIAEKLGFKDLMILSNHGERINSRENIRYLEDIFEAFMEALFQDTNENYKICKNFLLGIYKNFVNIQELIDNEIDHKSALLKFFHTKRYGPPKYSNIYYIGPTFSREFTCFVGVPNTVFILDNPPLDLTKCQQYILDTLRTDIKNEEISNLDAYKEFSDLMKTTVVVGMGKGASKKEAEQNCSLECLKNLKA